MDATAQLCDGNVIKVFRWRSTFTCDGSGTLASCTRTVYDLAGRVQYSMDARGTVTEYDYDADGRRTNVLVYLNYTVSNLVSGNISPSGSAMSSQSGYDPNGNQTNAIDALGRETDYIYDAANRLTVTQLPVMTGDLGRRTRRTVYDGLGRKTEEIDELGVNTDFTYDYRGLLLSVTLDARTTNAATTTYDYDESGQMTAQTDANGHATLFQYDALGRRTKRTLPHTEVERLGYDWAGNLILQTNFNGVVITNQYDVLNRLTNRASAGGLLAAFTYTPNGQRATMTDASGTTTYIYDSLNRLATNATPEGALYYTYDVSGNVTNVSSSTPSGTSVAYQYDTLSRLTNVVDGRLVGTNHTGYGFDRVGNLQQMQLPCGVTNFYQYDSLNRLTNLVWQLGATPLASFAYRLDVRGLRTNAVEADISNWRTVTWVYDHLRRLTNEVISQSNHLGNYTYDAVGNRTNFSDGWTSHDYAYNANDWLTNDTYDSNGNTTVSGGTNYQYDVENRLTNAGSGAVMIVYNGDGQRVKKTVGGVTTLYLVDGKSPSGYPQVVEELMVNAGTTNLTLTRAYTYGLSIISQRLIGTSTNFYGMDGHGNVRYLFSTNGAITDTFRYDAYGILIDNYGAGTPNRHWYCGEEWDADLGMYYLRARYYQPATGRFWTMDSYEGDNEDPQSLHKYLYCSCNPVGRKDASGHSDEIEIEVAAPAAASFDSGALVATAVARAFFMRRLEMAVASWTIETGVILTTTAVAVGGYELAESKALNQEFERIKTQSQQRANPTGSKFAYQNFECDTFAGEAFKFYKNDGKDPQIIRFDAYRSSIKQDAIWATVGVFAGKQVSQAGFHEGVLVDGKVYDNNLPFGVSRRLWEKYAYLVDPMGKPVGSFISLRKAVNQNYGVITIFP